MKTKHILSILLAIIFFPLLPLYLFAALNLRSGYSKLFCGAQKQSTRDRIIEEMQTKGIPLPNWLKTKPKSC
ncbi:secreted protein [Candidatus Magnetoovum chiemensis]|nr:secreted protein [Candidatus Magnetoovum chiemensis]